MADVLITSRSFGEFVRTGLDILSDAGLTVYRPGPEERPVTEARLLELVDGHNPQAIIIGSDPITSAVLASAERLRLVMKHGVGVDNIDIDASTDAGILVANAPDTNTHAVADLTIGMILVLLRGIAGSAMSARSGGWERVVGNELGARTVGVVGTGKIGSEVIRRLVPFGPEILGHDVVQDERLIASCGVAYVSLAELLERSNVITLHVPLLPQTHHLIGRRQLESLKEDVKLVNIARGGLVDERALEEFLRAHPRAAAALDVFTAEPPQESPLLKLENVVPTTHIGGYTYEALARMDRVCAETVVAVLSGESPPNVLNPLGRERPSSA
jgi:phosphoglycerate dehydrogenase-like enzyme